MRKVVMLNRISVDGFFAGPNGEIDWFVHDHEVDKAVHQMMNLDTLLLGRETFQMFSSYWPHVGNDPNAPQEARALATELNQMTKVVFSKTLKDVAWENSQLVGGDVAGTVSQLKQGAGADIGIFGSGTIVQQLAAQGLIDTYVIVVTPTILGEGKPLFKPTNRTSLELRESKSFASGNVILRYTTKRN